VFFGVVVLQSWWLVNGSSDKEGCHFAAIHHSFNYQLVYVDNYTTILIQSRGVKRQVEWLKRLGEKQRNSEGVERERALENLYICTP